MPHSTSSCSHLLPLIFLDTWQLPSCGEVVHLVLDTLAYGLLQCHVLRLAEVDGLQIGSQIYICHVIWFVVVFKYGAHTLQTPVHLVTSDQVVVLLSQTLRLLQVGYIAFG